MTPEEAAQALASRRGASLWADHWLAGSLNDEVYDDEDWPIEEVTGRDPVD